MIAALVDAATPTLGAMVLVVLGRTGFALLAPRSLPYGAFVLDDRTWRDEQLAAVGAEAIRQDRERAAQRWADAKAYGADTAALAVVYAARHPLDRSPRGIDVITQWWTPTPVIGRPPLTVHRIPGAALIGASA